jgi:hypothetical protein
LGPIRDGHVDHVGAPLDEDRVEAGAQAIPPPLERRDAGITVADFKGDDARRKGFLQLVQP